MKLLLLAAQIMNIIIATRIRLLDEIVHSNGFASDVRGGSHLFDQLVLRATHTAVFAILPVLNVQ